MWQNLKLITILNVAIAFSDPVLQFQPYWELRSFQGVGQIILGLVPSKVRIHFEDILGSIDRSEAILGFLESLRFGTEFSKKLTIFSSAVHLRDSENPKITSIQLLNTKLSSNW